MPKKQEKKVNSLIDKWEDKPKDDYKTKNKGFITHSKLCAFRFCEQFYKLKYVDDVVPDQEDSDALVFGSAFDLYIQSEEEFNKKYTAVSVRYDVKQKTESLEKKAGELKEKQAKKPLTDKQAETLKGYEAEIKEIKANKDKTQITPKMASALEPCLNELKRHKELFEFDNSKDACQKSFEIEYKGYKLRGSLDNYMKSKNRIKDVKTIANIGEFAKVRNGFDRQTKYKDQLTFYQFLEQMVEDKEQMDICDGELMIVSWKEDIPKALYIHFDPQSLYDNRRVLLEELDRMIDVLNLGIFAASPREKCLTCDAYGVCPYSEQKEYVEL